MPSLVAGEHHVRWHAARLPLPRIDGGFLTAVAMTACALPHQLFGRPSVVLATGPRFSNFLAGRWLARLFGAKLVLQYRDEWTVQTPLFVQATADDRAEEARCLARADLVAFVSEAKRAAYREALPQLDARKAVVIPNGWDPYFHAKAENDTRHLQALKGRFTLTYTGRWHASLAPLLETIERLLDRRPDLADALSLVIVGDQLAINAALFREFERRRPGTLMAMPAVAPKVAIEIQRESSALLLVNDHSYDGVVPLKTFDYACSARPILVFGSSGGAAPIIRELGAGMAVDVGDVDGFAVAIDAMRSADPAIWDTPARRRWASANRRTDLNHRFMQLIADL
ncbi:MAG: hypothetical protein IT548_03820 [Alphaproteobacteria bacterium]|nr:hypothetical protein [Alphaproteobacteria bacterium]